MGQRIGFIGVGKMGLPMAERLVDAGHAVRLFDLDAAAAEPLVERGAALSVSPADAARGTEVTFACLPTPEASREVAAEVARGEVPRFYVETSTIGSAAVRWIEGIFAARGVPVIDAPVSGGPRGARAGLLTMMVSGEPGALAALRPFLDAIARNVFEVGGEPGLAQVAKLANNVISAAAMAISFEASVMAVKAGLDARTLIDVVNASTGRNGATLDKFPQSVLPRTFDYGGKLSTMFKDIELCMDEADRLLVPMWVGSAVRQLWFHAMTEGRGDADYTSLIQMIEAWGGAEVRGAAAAAEPPAPSGG